jgi:hypothetical protein
VPSYIHGFSAVKEKESHEAKHHPCPVTQRDGDDARPNRRRGAPQADRDMAGCIPEAQEPLASAG